MAGYIGYGDPGVRQSAPPSPGPGQGSTTSADRPPGAAGPTSYWGNQLGSFFDLYKNAVIDPTQQQGNIALNQLQDQKTLQDQMAMLSGGQLQQQAGFQQQALGLDRSQLGIQQGALARQMDLLPQQFALQNQGFDLSQQQANYGAMTGMRDLNWQQSARGAYTSEGANAHRGDINQNLGFQTQGINLQRQGAGLNFKESQAAQQDAKKELGLQSQRLGLSGQEIQSRLNNALQQLGISNQVDSNKLLQEAGKVRQGMVSPLQGLFADILNISGVPLVSGGQ